MTTRPWLLLALLLTAAPRWAPAADEARAAAPGPPAEPAAAALPFAPGEELVLEVDYLGLRMGRARLRLGEPAGSIWPVICQGETDGIASILDIREHYVSYWDSESQVSRGSDLNAIEVGDRHTDRARIDRENGVATVRVMRKGRVTERRHEVPRDVHDLASALLALRARALAPGSRLDLPVFSGNDLFTMRAEVEGIERVDTPAGSFDALRIKLRLGFTDKFKTDRDSHVWLTNDARRIPVKARADFAVGSVIIRLVAYHPGGQFAAR
jgi:hypothetical protein